MTHKTEIAKVLAMLAVAYPKFKPSKDTTEVYAQLLADIPIEELRAAALQCATSKDFFPSVHELRAAVTEIRRKAASVPSAFEAWQDLKRAGMGVTKIATEEDGKYYIEESYYQFAHPLVQQVAEMLGWPSEFPGDNPVADRAHFFKAYDQALFSLLERETMLPEVKEYIDRRKLEGGKDGKPKRISAVIE